MTVPLLGRVIVAGIVIWGGAAGVCSGFAGGGPVFVFSAVFLLLLVLSGPWPGGGVPFLRGGGFPGPGWVDGPCFGLDPTAEAKLLPCVTVWLL